MDTIKVVCGIIFDNNKVFICRRKPGKSLEGYWEFPGGKVEIGETFEQSLLRELDEELGMKVIIDKHFKTINHQYENFTIELIAFLCKFQEATFCLNDHDKMDWVECIDLEKYQFAPADIPLIKVLYEQ